MFSHLKLDPQLKETLRNTFPDAFPKRVTSIADNLAEPSDIIDFDAIRGSAPTTPTEPNPPAEASTSSGATLVNGKGSGAAMVKGVKIEPKMSHSDGKLATGIFYYFYFLMFYNFLNNLKNFFYFFLIYFI